MSKMRKPLSWLLALAMVLSLLPMSVFATGGEEGKVTASKTLVSQTPDENGNYTIQLSVQGNSLTTTTPSNADVVLVVDNSGSMSSSVGTPCLTPKERFEEHLWLGTGWYECPNCHARYYSFIGINNCPEECIGETGRIARINAAKEVSKEFANSILFEGSQNRMAVIGFSHNDNQGGADDGKALKVTQGLTNSKDAVVSTVEAMKADGGTNYSAALEQAYNWLNSRPAAEKNRPAYVIFISDGIPGLYETDPKQNDLNWNGKAQAQELETINAKLYTIGIALKGQGDIYLKSLASDQDHYKNVTTEGYKDELSNILKQWAEEINTVPAGTNAKLVDVISENFTLVANSASTELEVGDDGKTLTWEIGNIPTETKTVSFMIHPVEGKYGKLPTNASVELTYTDAAGKPQTLDEDDLGNPEVTIAAPQYTITASAGDNGSISPSGTVSVTHGGNQGFTITPNTGYVVDTVTVDETVYTNNSETAVGPNDEDWSDYTFENVQEPHAISVTFAADENDDNIPDKYQVTVTYDVFNGTWTDGGTAQKSEVVTLMKDGKWDEDGSATVTFPEVTANQGYKDGSWDPANSEVTKNSDHSFKYTFVQDDSQKKELSYTVEYYKDDVKADTETVTTEVWVNNPTNTLTVNKTQINTTNKYEGFVFEYSVPSEIPDEIENDGVIKVYYATDANDDDVPDKYQVKVTYDVVHGTWTEGGTAQKSEVVTLMKDGKWDEDGSATVTFPGVKANAGYKAGSWAPRSNVVTKDSDHSFVYTFVKEENPPVVEKRYTIEATAHKGGEISPDGIYKVYKYTDKTYTITADKGYKIYDVVVDGVSVGAVHTYTFERVTEDHTIEVYFAKLPTDPDDSGTSNWLETKDHVAYMTGYPDGTFGPNRNMTRAEVAQMFYALLLNKNVTTTVAFSDVSADAWYAKAVNTLASLGMVSGYPDGTFHPDAPITRAEFATIALAFAYEPLTASCNYNDVPTSAWFYTYVAQATTYGWIGGSNGYFRPNDNITRAEVSVIVNNMLGRAADEEYVDAHAGDLVTFPDVRSSFWAYYSIMETVNDHEYVKLNGLEDWK